MESVQRFFTKTLAGHVEAGLRRPAEIVEYPITHSLEYRRLYSDLVLCFQLLSNSFNSQLANVLIKQ